VREALSVSAHLVDARDDRRQHARKRALEGVQDLLRLQQCAAKSKLREQNLERTRSSPALPRFVAKHQDDIDKTASNREHVRADQAEACRFPRFESRQK